MSYCKKKKIYPNVFKCLECKYCLPPAKRINGKMCEYEIIEKETDELPF